jgi:hypothetical protein
MGKVKEQRPRTCQGLNAKNFPETDNALRHLGKPVI